MATSITGPAEQAKNPAAVELGRRGGLAGGLQKWFQSLTPAERRKQTRKAARRRWESATPDNQK